MSSDGRFTFIHEIISRKCPPLLKTVSFSNKTHRMEADNSCQKMRSAISNHSLHIWILDKKHGDSFDLYTWGKKNLQRDDKVQSIRLQWICYPCLILYTTQSPQSSSECIHPPTHPGKILFLKLPSSNLKCIYNIRHFQAIWTMWEDHAKW